MQKTKYEKHRLWIDIPKQIVAKKYYTFNYLFRSK